LLVNSFVDIHFLCSGIIDQEEIVLSLSIANLKKSINSQAQSILNLCFW